MTPSIRNMKGELPLWQDGSWFASWQGEWFQLGGQYSTIEAQIGVLQLETGEWLSSREGFALYAERFATREEALRAAVESVIDRVTNASQWRALPNGYKLPPNMGLKQANSIIEWASAFIGLPSLAIKTDSRPPAPKPWEDLPLFAI